MKDQHFIKTISELERITWLSFKALVNEFLGNTRAINYVEVVNKFLDYFKNIGCHMSFKVHFLNGHLDSFPENIGAVSDEQGKRFHQDLEVMEVWYQGRWNEHMMADYCWSIRRNCPHMPHCRKSGNLSF